MIFFPFCNFISVKDLSEDNISHLLDRAEEYLNNRCNSKHTAEFPKLIQANLFFENSTRTQSSFEIAGKRLGFNVINVIINNSSMKKGETLLDTVMTLNASKPDILVIRHPCPGAIFFLLQKTKGSAIINAGDGTHEHPTQALLDALAIRRFKGQLSNLTIAICGDILHSRVARSNIILLNTMGARVRVIAPITLLPENISHMGVEIFHDMKKGLKDVDVIMVLRLQIERMSGALIPSLREYSYIYSLDKEKIKYAKKDVLVMHPGPMNRGIEISSDIADGSQSIIQNQVEMGVAIRMAVIKELVTNRNNHAKKKT
ncbi:aspartate carbamoyltransferase catalytic subunit [Candidatus Liberibacter sp.]|uniref:aspartate carbamoyltransferase catalytic subunit n=1 Tax=Candidatus Liberibacter sp. TaxID=34022 RepID=UPI0015F3E007|nr:aspartate carbamoyltransferase catalytic subunit [Candidatus Liberibacter sp.]MBA5724070.1 aspartate carbamoyltransferase catalytic subunit [Candidatus Liberibacter sp.]